MAEETSSSPGLLREIFLAGFMAGLPPENVAWAAARLSRAMEDVHLRTGEVLYRAGDATTGHYFVVSGEVKLEVEGAPPWLLGERSLVGTIDLTLDRRRARTVIATRDTHLLSMGATDWLDMLEDNFELMLRGVEGLAQGVHALRVGLGDFEEDHAGAPIAPVKLVPSGRLGLIESISLLWAVPLFAEAEVQALAQLAEVAREVDFAAGDLVSARGAPNDSLLVLVSGEVTASRAGSAGTQAFGPGMLVFGSLAASSQPLGYEAVAQTAARALRIPREDYFDAMEEHFALARSAMKLLAREREVLVNEKERRAWARG